MFGKLRKLVTQLSSWTAPGELPSVLLKDIQNEVESLEYERAEMEKEIEAKQLEIEHLHRIIESLEEIE